MTHRLMTIAEVAERLNVPIKTLYNWRHLGRGPRSIRVAGRSVRYRPEDVEAWLASRPALGGDAA